MSKVGVTVDNGGEMGEGVVTRLAVFIGERGETTAVGAGKHPAIDNSNHNAAYQPHFN